MDIKPPNEQCRIVNCGNGSGPRHINCYPDKNRINDGLGLDTETGQDSIDVAINNTPEPVSKKLRR
jgi:hypothetical protein